MTRTASDVNFTKALQGIAAACALAATTAALAGPALAQAVSHASVYTQGMTEGVLPAAAATAATNLKLISPRRLPLAALRTHNALRSGALAAGALAPGAVAGSADGAHPQSGIAPDAFGAYSPLAIAPYTTARASAVNKGPGTTPDSVAVTSYPWRATGKLYFNIGTAPYVCSASLIGKGVLLTAGHCVYEFGTNSAAGWHTNFVFAPAQYDPSLAPPYGTWTAVDEWIPTPYYTGSDTCVTAGVVCNNDIAVIVMAPNAANKQPGNVVGWYGYGWNGYSYTSSFGGAWLASITQLGYPVAFDSGLTMERTDGIGAYWTSGNLHNTVLGTAMTGGSSGGPWLVNFGTPPAVDTTKAAMGNATDTNIVVGVTSWGYTTVGDNTQGASWFGQNAEYPNASYTDKHGVNRGAGNIGQLMQTVCNAHYSSC